MLVREPSAEDSTTLSEQGLYAFSFFDFAPSYNKAMPFYFHTGLVYKGLLPGRDKDQMGAAFGLGTYSADKIAAENAAGKTTHQTYEGVMAVNYRGQLTRFAYVQPFRQYIIRPNGNGLVSNANSLEVHLGVTF